MTECIFISVWRLFQKREPLSHSADAICSYRVDSTCLFCHKYTWHSWGEKIHTFVTYFFFAFFSNGPSFPGLKMKNTCKQKLILTSDYNANWQRHTSKISPSKLTVEKTESLDTVCRKQAQTTGLYLDQSYIK
jgi:hypothetical protein